jgi:hypothetical protein
VRSIPRTAARFPVRGRDQPRVPRLPGAGPTAWVGAVRGAPSRSRSRPCANAVVAGRPRTTRRPPVSTRPRPRTKFEAGRAHSGLVRKPRTTVVPGRLIPTRATRAAAPRASSSLPEPYLTLFDALGTRHGVGRDPRAPARPRTSRSPVPNARHRPGACSAFDMLAVGRPGALRARTIGRRPLRHDRTWAASLDRLGELVDDRASPGSASRRKPGSSRTAIACRNKKLKKKKTKPKQEVGAPSAWGRGRTPSAADLFRPARVSRRLDLRRGGAPGRSCTPDAFPRRAKDVAIWFLPAAAD